MKRCSVCLLGGALLGLGITGALFYAAMWFGTDSFLEF